MPRRIDPSERATEAPVEQHEHGSANGSRVVCVRRGLRFDVGRDVAVPPDVAASLLRDTQRWTEWSPTISGVESDDRYVREDTRGRVRVAGAWIPFRVTGFNGRRWTWRIAGLPATGHRVEGYADDDERCRVIIEVPLPARGYVPACRRALDRFARLAVDSEDDAGTLRERPGSVNDTDGEDGSDADRPE